MAAASPDVTKPRTSAARCGAKTRGGSKCKLEAGKGTDHPGRGRCKFHGGSTPTHVRAAAREQVAELGGELQMEPHDAILLTVRRAAMWERYCASKVTELEDDDLVNEHFKERVVSGDGDSYVERSNESQLNLWIREHQKALTQLASLAKTAVDAGVQERQVRLAERLGASLTKLLDGILGELELTAAQQKKAPAVVRKHLSVLEGGLAATG